MPAVVLLLTSALVSQIPLTVSPARAGQTCTMNITAAPPSASVYLAADTSLAPYWVASVGVMIDLALSPKCFLFPKLATDAIGSLSVTVPVTSGSADVGNYAHLQAIIIDPTTGRGFATTVDTMAIHEAPVPQLVTTNLALGDDQVTPVVFSFMSFPFYGTQRTSVHVSSNGRLSFGGGLPLALENVSNHLADEPSIAVLWDDLNPAAGGSVSTSEDPAGNWVQFQWNNVPQAGQSDANTVHCTLHASGVVTLEYFSIATNDCIVGISPGSNISAAPAVDFSTVEWRHHLGAVYEVFNGGFDLNGSIVTFSPYPGCDYAALVN
jgi:hypothetical protein